MVCQAGISQVRIFGRTGPYASRPTTSSTSTASASANSGGSMTAGSDWPVLGLRHIGAAHSSRPSGSRRAWIPCNTITTPATVTWFAYNAGAATNGVRHRISPELVYFYHSLGFASQFYHQDEKLQASAAKPILQVPIEGYYIMATYLLTGEQRHEYSEQISPFQDFDPHAPIASPGAWELVFRVERMEVGAQAFSTATPLASNTGATNRSSNPEPRNASTRSPCPWAYSDELPASSWNTSPAGVSRSATPCWKRPIPGADARSPRASRIGPSVAAEVIMNRGGRRP